MTGRTVGGTTLVEPATLPESGTWYRTDADVDGTPVWARVPDEGDGHEDEDALMRAWERLSHLDHPSIPRAVVAHPEADLLLVAAPNAVPLARLIEHRHDEAFTMTPGTLLDVGAQLADVMVHAHERGRPHGHLSPDTVCVTAQGRLVVWGFAGGPDVAPADRWTPPERARGRRPSGDADQWAIGAILASLVTGRKPWRSEDPLSDARVGDISHLSGPVMEQWKPLGRLIERTLSSEPRERFPSAHPVRQAIAAMQARVPQASDLPSMGAELLARFGPAPLTLRAPEPEPAARVMPVALDPLDAPELSDHGPATTVSEDGPPLDAYDSQAMSVLTPTMTAAVDSPTDVATSPTRVPLGDETFAGEEPDDADALETDSHPVPGSGGPTLMPEPIAPAAAALPAVPMATLPPAPSGGQSLPTPVLSPDVEGPPSMGDLSVATRDESDVEPEPAWHEQVPIRRIAPWAVGALVVVLVLYIIFG